MKKKKPAYLLTGKVCLSMPTGAWEEIDQKRGSTERSTFVRQELVKAGVIGAEYADL